MNKAELIIEAAKRAEIFGVHTEWAFNAMLSIMTDRLARGEKLSLSGFGVLEVRDRVGREGVNPRTGEAMEIEPCRVVKFRACEALKKRVNGRE